MRQNSQKQMPLSTGLPDQSRTKEVVTMSAILDANPIINDLVFKDLTGQCQSHTGCPGMTGEQVVRCAVLMRLLDCSYRELAFHLADSDTSRWFSRLPFGRTLRHSTLQSNISQVSPDTWEAINLIIVRYAAEKKIEKGRKTRTDTTVVTNAIHHPTDSGLLWDSVRVLTRLLVRARESGLVDDCRFVDHRRAAKRRMMEIRNLPRKKHRKVYRKLLALCQETVSDTIRMGTALCQHDTLEARWLANEMSKHLSLATRVMSQTWRRVINGEQVPATEKIVSIFEPHTDIIVKDRRDTYYGHKIILTTGRSSLIIDCAVEKGNPADVSLFEKSLLRQKEIYGRYPRQVAVDGGFTSNDNLAFAKGEGIKDVAFAKKRNLKILDMVKSEWVYRKLRNFRAGVEGCISALKRICGLGRCTWRTFDGFKGYVQSGVVTFNLLILARHLMS
jgi:IS5 family transposase